MTELKEQLLEILKEKEQKIIPENIRSGVNILGVEGNYMGGNINTDTSIAFTKLEYIESSDGNQYIDTGVRATSSAGAELTVLTPNTTETMFFGAWDNNNGLLFGQAGSHWFGDECYAVATDSAWMNAPGVKFDAGWHTFKYDATTGKSSIDGVFTDAPKNSGRNDNLYIFKTNGYGSCLAGTRVSRCKIYNKDIVIRDYIPVIYNLTGEVGMFDLVDKKFYGNIGTGAFVAGESEDAEYDIFLEMLTSDATATAGDIAKDKTAYVNGEKLIGTLEAGNYNAIIDTTIKAGSTTGSGINAIIKKVPEDLVLSGKKASYLFYGCSLLEEIPETLDTSGVTSASFFASGCTNLKYVPILNFSKITGVGPQDAFYGCPNLTDESLNNILYTCYKMTQIGYKNLKSIGLTEEQATLCTTLSNWSLCLAKGWTTGY